VRLGTADAIDAGIRDTPPYGKSASQGQMRQRNCSNARPMAGSALSDVRLQRGIPYSEAPSRN
jgi:hypothetical protein